MSNSSLVDYVNISPNRTSPRNHKIDVITPHCVVGQLSAKAIVDMFKDPAYEASCNYAIGKDGEIGLCVEESDRSWCSSNAANDHRAITIECASDLTDPYAINDKVYASLINLMADICKRNGIKSLKWKGDRNLIGQVDKQNITVHRWFANKACPGDYIYNRLDDIAASVNTLLSGTGKPVMDSSETKDTFMVKVETPRLNIRKGPGTNFPKTGNYTGIGVFTIVDVLPGEGSSSGWGKLKSGAGWISLDYVKII